MGTEVGKKYARGKNPNSLANLEKNKARPGEVHNPKGRPRNKLCLTAIARERLGEPCTQKDAKKGQTWAEYLVEHWLHQSIENATYFRELIERMDGKLTLTFGTNPDMPLVVDIGKVIAHVGDNGNN